MRDRRQLEIDLAAPAADLDAGDPPGGEVEANVGEPAADRERPLDRRVEHDLRRRSHAAEHQARPLAERQRPHQPHGVAVGAQPRRGPAVGIDADQRDRVRIDADTCTGETAANHEPHSRLPGVGHRQGIGRERGRRGAVGIRSIEVAHRELLGYRDDLLVDFSLTEHLSN